MVCNRNFYVTYFNRKLKYGDNYKNYKAKGKAVKACNHENAFKNVMKNKKGVDIEVIETDRLISSRVNGRVINIKRLGDKLR